MGEDEMGVDKMGSRRNGKQAKWYLALLAEILAEE